MSGRNHTFMRSLTRLISGLRNRSRIIAKQAYLYTRWRLKRRTLWIDYGWMRLPFHGDGDRQEVLYHLNGKQWWNNEHSTLSWHLKPGATTHYGFSISLEVSVEPFKKPASFPSCTAFANRSGDTSVVNLMRFQACALPS
jgi:hypothetical protein